MEDFSRIKHLLPYVFNITTELKNAARKRGEYISADDRGGFPGRAGAGAATDVTEATDSDCELPFQSHYTMRGPDVSRACGRALPGIQAVCGARPGLCRHRIRRLSRAFDPGSTERQGDCGRVFYFIEKLQHAGLAGGIHDG